MDLRIQPTTVGPFDETDWDKQELDLVLDSLQQDIAQVQETAELVAKFAKRVANR